MSRNMKLVNAPRKPCCKVCKDAGKPESVFSTHWPKDAKGNTVCPTLLDQECRFCHEKGHTVKYCKELAKKIAQDEREKKQQQQQPRAEEPKKQEPTKTTQQSRFAILMEDDDEVAASSAQPMPMKEEFPELGGTWTRRTQPTPVEGVSFVAMACKPREVAIAEKQEREKELQSVQGMVAITPTPLPQPKEKSEAELAAKKKHRYECFRCVNGKSWADMDSDDEDDVSEAVASNDAW